MTPDTDTVAQDSIEQAMRAYILFWEKTGWRLVQLRHRKAEQWEAFLLSTDGVNSNAGRTLVGNGTTAAIAICEAIKAASLADAERAEEGCCSERDPMSYHLGHFLLVWVFWLNLQLATHEDLARRKKRGRPITFAECMEEASRLEVALFPLMVGAVVYVIGCWFSLVGEFGSLELAVWQWLLRGRA